MNLKRCSIFKQMASIWNQEKGIISILVTVLCLIGVLIIAFLIDRTNQNFIIQEVRGIMDSSAQNTLVSALSDDHLKEELFGFSDQFISESSADQTYPIPYALETQMHNMYERQLRDYVKTSSLILEVKVESSQFKFAKGKCRFVQYLPFALLSHLVNTNDSLN